MCRVFLLIWYRALEGQKHCLSSLSLNIFRFLCVMGVVMSEEVRSRSLRH